MALEDADFLSELVQDNPVTATDPVTEGSHHLRLLKKVLQQTFIDFDGPVTLTLEQLNGLADAALKAQDASITGAWDFKDIIKLTSADNFAAVDIDGFIASYVFFKAEGVETARISSTAGTAFRIQVGAAADIAIDVDFDQNVNIANGNLNVAGNLTMTSELARNITLTRTGGNAALIDLGTGGNEGALTLSSLGNPNQQVAAIGSNLVLRNNANDAISISSIGSVDLLGAVVAQNTFRVRHDNATVNIQSTADGQTSGLRFLNAAGNLRAGIISVVSGVSSPLEFQTGATGPAMRIDDAGNVAVIRPGTELSCAGDVIAFAV